MDFIYCTKSEELDEAISYLSDSDRLSMDTETYALPEWGPKGSALDPHTGAISLIIAKGKRLPVIFDVICLKHYNADFTKLKEFLLSRKYLLFHNAN